MKKLLALLFVLIAVVLVRGDAKIASTQDPLVVNSKTIALKLENQKARVLEATLKPGDKESLHSHPSYVIYVVAGGKYRNHATDGTVTEGEFKTGDTIMVDAHERELSFSKRELLELGEKKPAAPIGT